jgi:hypothetical protein
MLTNEDRDRKATPLFILTGLNLLTAALLIAFLYFIRIAIKGFAAGLNLWPLFVLVPLGAAESLTAVLAARKVTAQGLRIAGFVINGLTLSVYSVFICVAIGWFALIPRVHYVVPQGYMGDVYVIHNVAGAEPAKHTIWGVTYEVPKDGILLTQSPVIHRVHISSYYYRHEDGGLQRIEDFGQAAIKPTMEDLADDKNVGVHFPGPGTLMSSSFPCAIEYEKFYVGTKANYLSHPPGENLLRLVRDHPEVCGGRQK